MHDELLSSELNAKDSLMFSPDFIMQTHNSTKPPTAEEWRCIAEYVIRKLEDFLDVTIRFNGTLEDQVKDGISMDLTCIPKLANRLDFFMKGILASNLGSDGLTIGATMFLFCGGKRLISNKNDAFIDLSYRLVDGNGQWTVMGWFKDEYGEYPEFDEAQTTL